MKALPVLFGAALFSAAFLLFCVEPLVAKMMMPLLGGVPAVWNTCLVFFQGTLLLGYLLALGTFTGLGSRARAFWQLVIIGAPLLVMPIAINAQVVQRAAPWGPTVQALVTLTISTGLPFLALSTVAPTLQRWYTVMRAPGAKDPYFLYAASNLGSLSALITYPFLIEPYLGLHAQAGLMRAGYAAVVLLIVGCAGAQVRFKEADAERAAHTVEPVKVPPNVRRTERARWVFLSAVPSAYLVAVTAHLTGDVTPAPFLWVLPLAAYLLSFVFVFASKPPIPHAVILRAWPLAGTVAAYLLATRLLEPLSFVLGVHLLAFFIACLKCHGELVRTRPASSRLNEFYVWMSVGGFIGGVAIAIVAPRVSAIPIEYPICIVLASLARESQFSQNERERRAALGYPVALFVGALLLAALLPRLPIPVALAVPLVPALPLLVACVWRERAFFGFCLGAALLGSTLVPVGPFAQVLFRARNFFGAVRVERDAGRHLTRLMHGTTVHGSQSSQPGRRSEPLTYYSRRGPAGDVFRVYGALTTLPRRVGVIGLGAGTLATYAQPNESWTFFEINPSVTQIASNPDFFTFLSEAFPGGAGLRLVEGDARLQIATDPGNYGVLVIDAFSSDAIPVHLVTEEALSAYTAKLAPSGIIAWHVSNRHINLGPVLAELAAAKGYNLRGWQHSVSGDDSEKLDISTSWWVVMSQDKASLAPFPESWKPVRRRPGFRAWTDDRSSVVPVLSL